MSHPEQLAFFAACVTANREVIVGARILEIGSYDVNGSLRRLFHEAAEYRGYDLTEGPGVDEVGNGRDIGDPDASWDVTLSGECFEHDPHWSETLTNMVRLTRPGGLVAFTCASLGRVEHGTSRTSVVDSPGTQAIGVDYYRNVSAEDVRKHPLDEWFSSWHLHYAPVAADLYFAGVRRAGAEKDLVSASLPRVDEITALARIMPIGDRVARLPLSVLSRVIRDEERFQRLAIPYWSVALSLLRAAGTLGAAVRRTRPS